jgi:hypothetical protein
MPMLNLWKSAILDPLKTKCADVCAHVKDRLDVRSVLRFCYIFTEPEGRQAKLDCKDAI